MKDIQDEASKFVETKTSEQPNKPENQ